MKKEDLERKDEERDDGNKEMVRGEKKEMNREIEMENREEKLF